MRVKGVCDTRFKLSIEHTGKRPAIVGCAEEFRYGGLKAAQQ